MKTLTPCDIEEVKVWRCPYKRCAIVYEESEFDPEDGDEIECVACGRKMKFKDEC